MYIKCSYVFLMSLHCFTWYGDWGEPLARAVQARVILGGKDMLVITWLLLCAIVWALWNVHREVGRLDDLITQWQETLVKVKQLDDPEGLSVIGASSDTQALRVTVEISDAVELASRYHWAGSAGAMAPAVLKKVMQDKVLEQIQQSMREGGHEADVRVIVV